VRDRIARAFGFGSAPTAHKAVPGGYGPARAGQVRLADPVGDRDSEIAPADLAEEPQQRPLTADEELAEQATLSHGKRCFQEASRGKMPLERDWALAVAMEEGRQWLGWDDATHRVINLMDEEEPDKYVTDNLVAPLMLKWAAMVTMTKPDASPAPDTQSERDRAASGEALAVMGHLDRRHARQVQALERVGWAGTCGCVFTKLYWDPNELANIPVYGPDGQVEKKVAAPVGDVCEDVIPPFEMFLDPSAKRWRDVRWLIHATVKPLSWFQERYPDRGYLVEPDVADDSMGYVSNFEQAAFGQSSPFNFLKGNKGYKAAVHYEFWGKPTPKYPNGRYFCFAGDVLLTPDGPWPYKKPGSPGNTFPFVRQVYKEAKGHPYGRGLVPELAQLQVAYNRILTRMVCKVEDDKDTLLLEKGSASGADAYEESPGGVEEGRTLRKVWFDTGSRAPQWQKMLPLGADIFQLREIVWLDMQHIAGIHDVNMGGTPTGITAGISIELLQQGDRTQMGLFLQGLEQAAVEVAEWEISLYSQFAGGNLARMMGLDPSGNPGVAQFAAQSFAALTAGGACSVIVTPGSATPKTAAGQNQQILEYLQAGLFGPPGSVEAALIAVQLMSFARSDEVLIMLRQMLEQQRAAAQAAQPDPAQVEAMRQQGAAQMQQRQLTGAAEMQAISTHAQMQLEAQKHANELQKILVKAAVEPAAPQNGAPAPSASFRKATFAAPRRP
jgi:hypothetical protein